MRDTSSLGGPFAIIWLTCGKLETMRQAFDESLRAAFERARARLLKNMPLMDFTSDFGVGAFAMSKSEIDALESVGLTVRP